MTTDVLISYDTTGSMSPCIMECRRRITEALDELFGQIDGLRIGVISHGDYCDGDRVISNVGFTSDKEKLKQFIRSAPNTHGGDSDECYEYVLQVAKSYDWQADNKVLILIGDANPHGVGYKYGSRTYHIDWREEAQDLASMGVNIYGVQALGSSRSRQFYQDISNYTNGKRLDLSQFTDAVETIISVCYHKVGKLETYKDKLINSSKMNRNLAKVFLELDVDMTDVELTTRTDRSGLLPVPPSRFLVLNVDRDSDIKTFVTHAGVSFRKGRGFYQFTKAETVQERKEVVLLNKTTGDMFTGAEARNFIGLPYGERGRVRPVFLDEYDIFVQSTSANRILIGGYKFLYENELT